MSAEESGAQFEPNEEALTEGFEKANELHCAALIMGAAVTAKLDAKKVLPYVRTRDKPIPGRLGQEIWIADCYLCDVPGSIRTNPLGKVIKYRAREESLNAFCRRRPDNN